MAWTEGSFTFEEISAYEQIYDLNGGVAWDKSFLREGFTIQ